MKAPESIYKVDFRRLSVWNIFTSIRLRRVVALLAAGVSMIEFVYEQFRQFKQYSEYRLRITPQVCYLEKLLRDRYDKEQRRIYIKRAQYFEEVYLYQEAENRPLFLPKYGEEMDDLVLYTDSETVSVGVDFIVMVPVDVVFNENEMNALLDSHKLPGMEHKIQRF